MLPHFYQFTPHIHKNFSMMLQKNNRFLIACSILIQHLGDHGQKSIRQGTALLGTDLNTAHAVDAQVIVGLTGIFQGNSTQRTLLGTGTALDAAFACCRMESRGL